MTDQPIVMESGAGSCPVCRQTPGSEHRDGCPLSEPGVKVGFIQVGTYRPVEDLPGPFVDRG